jgi:hypothetical protein
VIGLTSRIAPAADFSGCFSKPANGRVAAAHPSQLSAARGRLRSSAARTIFLARINEEAPPDTVLLHREVALYRLLCLEQKDGHRLRGNRMHRGGQKYSRGERQGDCAQDDLLLVTEMAGGGTATSAVPAKGHFTVVTGLLRR